MYDTAYIVNWLRDKAARSGDHSFQRMLNAAAQRLEELSQSRRWTSVTVGLPPTQHESYEDIDGVIEWDASEPVLGITVAGDLILGRFVMDDGIQYWYDADSGEPCEVESWMPDPRKLGGCDPHG